MITRSSADAEDAAQDAFVKAFYALARFRRGEAFRPWILRIVPNEGRDRRRPAGRRGAGAGLARVSAGGAGAAAGGRAAGARVQVPARTVGGRDGRGPRRPDGNGEVAPVSGAREAPGGPGGGRGGGDRRP